MGLFGKSRSEDPDIDNTSGYIPPTVNNQDGSNVIERKDSPEMSEDDEGVMIITTSKSREEESMSKLRTNMSKVSKITRTHLSKRL